MPKENNRNADNFLDVSEVKTRMLFVMNNFAIFDNLAEVDWNKPFDEQNLDSFETTALITSFEHEFKIIFEDNIFESFETFNEIKTRIANDHNSIWRYSYYLNPAIKLLLTSNFFIYTFN